MHGQKLKEEKSVKAPSLNDLVRTIKARDVEIECLENKINEYKRRIEILMSLIPFKKPKQYQFGLKGTIKSKRR